MQLKPTVLWLHRWIGIFSAAFLFIVAVTGAVLVFEREIDRALNPDSSYVTPTGTPLPVETLLERFAALHPSERVGGIRVPTQQNWPYELALSNRLVALMNPYNGALLGVRNRSASFAGFLHALHTDFVAGRFGQLLVGWVTVLTLVVSITGLYLWWPRKIFAIHRYSTWRRTNFDIHNAIGFWASLVVFIMSLTGVFMTFDSVTDPLFERLNGSAAKLDVRALRSTPMSDRSRITVDAALSTARSTLPEASAVYVMVPSRPTDVFHVLLRFPEDRTPGGRSHVYMDQFSGRVLAVDSTRTAETGTWLLSLKRSAHTGDIFGAPTQALYFCASLALAGQAVTGILIWWKPKGGGRAKGRERNQRREVPAA